jgi:hypothetical protein
LAGVFECSSMTGTIATGAYAALAGNFKDFIVVDRLGTQILYDPMTGCELRQSSAWRLQYHSVS